VTPARCERSRAWISLRLDGMLSSMEDALLERHLDGCDSCMDFAAGVAAQTALLRAAALEDLQHPVPVPRNRVRAFRRGAVGVLAGAAAAMVAALVLAGPVSHTPWAGSTSSASSAPMIVVVAANPSPANSRVEVPHLVVRPASVVDGPVHGPFAQPA
jgi:predicted anti-sigma-YlaC factor YlaD